MKAMNKRRATVLPTRSDILYIIKHFDRISFEQLRKDLNITNGKLIQWCKLVFSNDDKEERWREIEQNLNQMEFHEKLSDSMQSEYIVHDMRRVGDKSFYTIKKKVVNEDRMCYLVTLDNAINVIVRFDIPIERSSIKYCPVSLGCDYEVHSIGGWEYSQLEKHLPVVTIQADEDYVGNFWLAMSNMLQHEA
jgi:hypothetical protein